MNRLVRALRSRILRWIPPAVVLAAVVEIGLRTTTLPRLCRALGVALQLGPAEHAVGRIGNVDSARERAAAMVLRAWPWARQGRCLRQSLVTGYLLRRRHPELHLGVAQAEGTTVAHAWLIVDGVVLDPIAYHYTPLLGRLD